MRVQPKVFKYNHHAKEIFWCAVRVNALRVVLGALSERGLAAGTINRTA